MSYRPKSTYQILNSSGNEWKTQGGQLYSGPYILTSGGAFMGNDITNMGQELIKHQPYSPPGTNNILESSNINEYYRLNPGIVRFIQKTKPIISTKNLPSKKDYEKGTYLRYFAKKINSLTEYYEIDLKTYKSINSQNPQYDFYSFGVGKILWALEGDVIKANKSILSQYEKTYPNISYLFPNLSEFVKPKTKTKKISPNLSKVTTKVQSRGIYHTNINDPYSGGYIPPVDIELKLKDLENNQIIKKSTPPGGGGY